MSHDNIMALFDWPSHGRSMSGSQFAVPGPGPPPVPANPHMHGVASAPVLHSPFPQQQQPGGQAFMAAPQPRQQPVMPAPQPQPLPGGQHLFGSFGPKPAQPAPVPMNSIPPPQQVPAAPAAQQQGMAAFAALL